MLLFAQHEGYVHPIAHLAGLAAPSQETALSTTHATADCVECALLSAGSAGVVGDATALPPAARVGDSISLSFQTRAADVPAWFRSRAPPVLL